ncbi:MAG: DUF2157 domain-containing protein [Pseudomonadota bacterium]|nr:DUF2157 domain-containing protein [Pseudomonadota bacterium]
MLEGLYRKRLGQDLAHWQKQGWVTAEGATAILASVGADRSAVSLSAVIAVLGAVLLGFGVMSLVAANWELIPRLTRFVVLVGAMGLVYALAAVLHRRNHPAFAEAALLLAGLVFAAAIALVAQSYHLSGEFPDAVLLWAVGCLGGALLARSAALTVLALLGSAFWTGLVTFDLGSPHWAGLVPILAGGALATLLDSRPGRTCAVLALGAWIAITIVVLVTYHRWPDSGGYALGAVAALALWTAGSALASLRTRPRLASLGHDMLWPSLGACLAWLAVLQALSYPRHWGSDRAWLAMSGLSLAVAAVGAVFAWRRKALGMVDVLAVLGLGAGSIALAFWLPPDGFAARLIGGCLVMLGALWVVSLGQSGRQPAGKTTGLVVFGLEAIYLYTVTLGTMFDTALAFLGGGVLFIALSVTLIRIDRRLAARAMGASA